ncbi:MAG TPA: ABC transporter permease subunit [Thermotogota bacterium]|jgi:maltose/maltodextrin transport system permease protein|nr:MAG: Maltose transport system permease protein MalG [Thermotogota bacterium ADurb.Bin062]HNW46960.1 ABC transporter permease subunit [Thermotogota bacterium]HOD91772.1 ABC transporter permease subunit [Thermotogota bacterium]HOF23987.1 ABC transporter permease subunit [Thermotogota bacterium]HOS25214.1 ABC transporter permease subunit [Thermotogota bacterium]
MVEKKRFVGTHITLAIVLVVVLFPLFWVFTTSIRRDNAAFSTELISSRLTLQHYKELLFKPKNLPVLIADMKQAAYISKQYKDWDEDRIQRALVGFIDQFAQHLLQTEEALKRTDEDVRGLELFYEEKKREALAGFFAERSQQEKDYELYGKQRLNELDPIGAILLDAKILGHILKQGYVPEVLPILEKRFPELFKSYEAATSEVNGALKRAREELSALISGTTLSEETLASLSGSIDAFEALAREQGFSYTKWLRDVSIKLYNPLNARFSAVSEELSQRWEAFKEAQKTIAREIESALKALDQFLKTQYESVNEKKAKEVDRFIDAWQTHTQELATLQKNLKQNQERALIVKKTLEALDSDLSLLRAQIGIQSALQEKALGIIETYLAKPDKLSTDKLLLERRNVFDRETESLLEEIRRLEANDDAFAKSGLLPVKESLTRVRQHQDRLKRLTGYLAIDDAIQVFQNTFPVIKTICEEIRQIFETQSKTGATLVDIVFESKVLETALANRNEEIEALSTKTAFLQNRILESNRDFDFYLLHSVLKMAEDWKGIGLFAQQSLRFLSQYPKELRGPVKSPDKAIDNLNQLRTLIDSFHEQKRSVYATTATLNADVKAFKERSPLYIGLRKTGAQIKVLELEEIEALYTQAAADFSSSLNRTGRKSSDLSKDDFFLPIKGALHHIDKSIFEMMLHWIKKPEQFFMRWLLNSMIIAVITSFITVVVCSFGAYPYSRMRFPGRKNGLLLLVLLQMFPSIMAMVALYSLLRFTGMLFPFLGLDTQGGIVFIYLGALPFNMWLLKGYFDTLPNEIEESALIDGATRFQTFYKIVLPLSTPILAVVFILCFMSTFNEFVLARIMLQSPQNYTFAVGLQSFSSGPYQMEWGLFTAAALIGAIPMVIVFLLIQKYLVGGLTSGAVKG